MLIGECTDRETKTNLTKIKNYCIAGKIEGTKFW